MAAGVDVNAKGSGDVFGFGAMMGGGGERTPLSWATSGAHKEVAELLIAEGADVNAKTTWGGTPLHEAAQQGHKKIVELLITKGAEVNAKDEGGKTPLHKAAGRGHKEIAELLIANGADVNATSNVGITPLHEAADLEHFVEVFRGHDSRWVVAGLLWMVGADGYAAHAGFVRDSLRHGEAVIRETALEIFLANEPGEVAVAAQCELSAKDACKAVVLLAKRKLSTL